MDISNLTLGGNDPFADIDIDDDEPKKKKGSKKKSDDALGEDPNLIHIRVQQRNGRKCITTVQGLSTDLDLKKILKAIKKAECCNGTVVEDESMGLVLQFQGDQRDAVGKFLTTNEIVDATKIKKHGAG